MFIITQEEDNIESGTYATLDKDGFQIVQVFENKDDAIMYNTQLEALGFELSISEIDDDDVDKMMDTLGIAYSVVEEGDLVIPKLEMLQQAVDEALNNSK